MIGPNISAWTYQGIIHAVLKRGTFASLDSITLWGYTKEISSKKAKTFFIILENTFSPRVVFTDLNYLAPNQNSSPEVYASS